MERYAALNPRATPRQPLGARVGGATRNSRGRPGGTIRVVPIPPVLADMLRQHLRQFGTAPDGRLFPGARGGMLSESVYGRAWHAARHAGTRRHSRFRSSGGI